MKNKNGFGLQQQRENAENRAISYNFFFFFLLFKAVPVAYGGSQARD